MRAPVLDAAALRIVGGEIQPADARQGRSRRRTSGTAPASRTDRSRPDASRPSRGGACAQYQHLGMRGRVTIALDPVAGSGDDGAGADRAAPRRPALRPAPPLPRPRRGPGPHRARAIALSARPAYLLMLLRDRSDNAERPTPSHPSRQPTIDQPAAHCKSDCARRAVLAARRRALDRRGPGLGRRRDADQPGRHRHRRQRHPGRRQAIAGTRAAAAVALPQAGRAGHDASRRERPADRVRRVAGGAAAADLGRPARPQFRGAAAADQ